MPNSRYVGDICISSWNRPECREREEGDIDSKVKIYNKIDIVQKGVCKASGGNGGNGGNENSAAAADGTSAAIAVSAEVDLRRIADDFRRTVKCEEAGNEKGKKAETAQIAAGIPAASEETEAKAGNGGDGGDGGVSTLVQTLIPTVNNITVVFSGTDADVEVETDGPGHPRKKSI